MTKDGLALFLQEIIVEYDAYRDSFRRTAKRENVSVPVEARRIDESGNAVGPAIHLVTRDVSSNGLGLFHHQPVEVGLLEMIMESPVNGHRMRIIARVEHCTPCGRYFIIGCQFVRAAMQEA